MFASGCYSLSDCNALHASVLSKDAAAGKARCMFDRGVTRYVRGARSKVNNWENPEVVKIYSLKREKDMWIVRFGLDSPILDYKENIYYGFAVEEDGSMFHGESMKFMDSMVGVPEGTVLKAMRAGQ
jgi:hypothetical protein